MKLFVPGTIKLVEKKEFDDKENPGETISYFINTIVDDEMQKLEATSGTDYSELEGKHGVATIELDKNGQGVLKAKLKSFAVGASGEKPEEEIL